MAAPAPSTPLPTGPLARSKRLLVSLAGEVRGSARISSGPRAFMSLVRNSVAYRAMHLVDLPQAGGRRTVRLGDGTVLSHRLDEGDIRGIIETWMQSAYELPVSVGGRNLLDLGANIGSTGVWLGRRYGFERILAVEPSPGSADLLRINLAQNGIDAEVVQAAIGPAAGTARFEVAGSSTLSRLSGEGIEVRVVTPQSLVDRFPEGEQIDLVKMDVEGAERDVLGADLSWLDRVRAMVIEFHHGREDAEQYIGRIVAENFVHHEVPSSDGWGGELGFVAMFTRP